MKKIFLISALVWLSFAAQAQTAPAEISAQVKAWHDNLTKGDLAAVQAQYASDAVFFPTFINSARTPAEREQFLKVLIGKKPVATLNTDQRIRVFESTATASGTWVFDVNNAEGLREKKPVRYLFVFEQRAGKWLIIEQHVSAFPVKN